MLKNVSKMNLTLLIVPVMIFILGFVTLVSTSQERGREHALFFLAGVLIYFFISMQDYKILYYVWKYLYLIVIVLLGLTYFLGEVRYGASRWLDLGFMSFQPSEFAKLVLIIFVSAYIYEKRDSFSKPQNIFKLFLMFLPLMVSIFLQPDLGTSLILLSVFVGIIFFAGLNKLYLVLLLIFAGILSNPIWHLLQDYQKNRILVFLNPKLDVLGAGYNVIQSLIAIGAGGLYGMGYSRGTQTHLNFLPAYWTDFAFASFAEEWGFIGVVGLLLLYLILFLSIIWVINKTKEPFGQMLAFGIFMVFFVQFTVNIGMNLGVMPATGIPLPLVSYGGTSLILSMVLLGIVQSIWTQKNRW